MERDRETGNYFFIPFHMLFCDLVHVCHGYDVLLSHVCQPFLPDRKESQQPQPPHSSTPLPQPRDGLKERPFYLTLLSSFPVSSSERTMCKDCWGKTDSNLSVMPGATWRNWPHAQPTLNVTALSLLWFVCLVSFCRRWTPLGEWSCLLYFVPTCTSSIAPPSIVSGVCSLSYLRSSLGYNPMIGRLLSMHQGLGMNPSIAGKERLAFFTIES
jgi:hypothetical protein